MRPAFTADSALFTLAGWNLVLHCPVCGPKETAGDDILKTTRGSVPLGRWLPKLTCRCGRKPDRLEAVCVWIMKYGRDPLHKDLTDLAIVMKEAA